MFAERVVTTANVAALRTSPQMEPPSTGFETLHTTGSTRWHLWINGVRHDSASCDTLAKGRDSVIRQRDQKAGYWSINRTREDPSPTAAPTRLVEPIAGRRRRRGREGSFRTAAVIGPTLPTLTKPVGSQRKVGRDPLGLDNGRLRELLTRDTHRKAQIGPAARPARPPSTTTASKQRSGRLSTVHPR